MTTSETTEAFLRRHLAGDFLLWSPNIQAEAYLHWDKLWATRSIPRGTPRPLPRAATPLDLAFASSGATRSIDDLMTREFVSGLLLVKDGEIKLERYAMGLTPEARWQSSSMVKSLTAMMVGAAVHDGVLAIDELVTRFLPEFAGSAYEGVTIRDLLLMASGVYWTESTDDPTTDVAEHYIKAIAARRPGYVWTYLRSRRREYEPGSQFYYNSADPLLLSYILSRVTGGTVADYCSRKIWQPMGCEQDGFFILDSDDGQEVVGSCCGASLRDYARWGLLMLADGIAADGTQVLPKGWVAKSTTPAAPQYFYDFGGARGPLGGARSAFTGYGYMWWIRADGDYQALGSYGQWIYVSPANNTVAVILGAVPRHVYMTAEDRALHAKSSHCGSEMRRDFIKAAMAALA